MNGTNRAMVAVCDILGFSNLVRERPLQEIVEYHIENFQTALASSIPDFPHQPIQPTEEIVFSEGLVGYAAFSDTVIIYSLRDDRDGYRNVINSVTSLLARHILWLGLRFRIGIAYEEFYADPSRNIYVGRALIDAHELERRQDWCGAALTNTAAELIPNQYPYRHFLIQYDVPIREGTALSREAHFVINWTLANHNVIPQEYGWLEREYNSLSEEQRGAVEQKLRNTERFHFETCVQCRAYRNRVM